MLALFSASSVYSQEKINILKVGGNLLGLFSEGDDESYGGAGLSIEHQLGSKTTLGFNVGLNTKKSEASDGNFNLKARVTLITIEPEFRFYPKSATNGFYIGIAPALTIISSKISGDITASDSESFFGGGLKTGYQFPLTSRLHLQIGGGFAVLLPKEDTDGFGRYDVNLMLGFQL